MPWPPPNKQLDAVTKYLEAVFPGLQIDVKYEDADMVHRFRVIEKSRPTHELQLKSGRSMFEDGDDIVSILKQNGVAQKMRDAGSTPVRVGKFSGKVLIS
jgi:hypothetical protein